MEQKEGKQMHWSKRLAKEVLERKGRREEYVITSGMTTSGPTHLGTVCEFLFPYAIKKASENLLKQRKEKAKVRHIFIFDIMDAFDSIPEPLKEHEEKLKPHLGKPLYTFNFPGEEISYGEYFMREVEEVMEKMGIKEEIERVKINELYKKGAFDKYAKLYLDNLEKVREIVEKTSKRQLKKDWYPIFAICKNCGRISTTRITKIEKVGEDYQYEYVCDKDVGYTKGCGYKGKDKLSSHNYKLQWRLHWPAWQDYFNTAIEGGGVDHFTKGGSWDTARAIHKEIFKKDPPIGYKFGFILIEGKKYSKSKGRGMSVKEMIKLIPPKALAYHLLKFDLQENIDFNPTKENVLKLINDYEYAHSLFTGEEEIKGKADVKKKEAYAIVKGKDWKGNFRDYLLYYQIYKDWKKVGMHLGVKEEEIEKIKPYIEEWVKRGFIPETYDFSYNPKKASGIIREFFCSLREGMSSLEIHNFVYEFAKEKGVSGKQIFEGCYETLIGKKRGPRLGRLIFALGVDKVKKDVC